MLFGLLRVRGGLLLSVLSCYENGMGLKGGRGQWDSGARRWRRGGRADAQGVQWAHATMMVPGCGWLVGCVERIYLTLVSFLCLVTTLYTAEFSLPSPSRHLFSSLLLPSPLLSKNTQLDCVLSPPSSSFSTHAQRLYPPPLHPFILKTRRDSLHAKGQTRVLKPNR